MTSFVLNRLSTCMTMRVVRKVFVCYYTNASHGTSKRRLCATVLPKSSHQRTEFNRHRRHTGPPKWKRSCNARCRARSSACTPGTLEVYFPERCRGRPSRFTVMTSQLSAGVRRPSSDAGHKRRGSIARNAAARDSSFSSMFTS